MNVPTLAPREPLPVLIDRATQALATARTSAEVLEARDMACIAYGAAKSAGRIARAKKAHDTIIMQVYAAQAQALAIEARAKMRLADAYDAAQKRGDVATGNRTKDFGIPEGNTKPASVDDLGFSSKAIHEARKLRDAEAANPGLIDSSIDNMIAQGEEPTKARLKKAILPPEPKPQMQREPLWVWGMVKDFHRDGILKIPPQKMAKKMTPQMAIELRRFITPVCQYLKELESQL